MKRTICLTLALLAVMCGAMLSLGAVAAQSASCTSYAADIGWDGGMGINENTFLGGCATANVSISHVLLRWNNQSFNCCWTEIVGPPGPVYYFGPAYGGGTSNGNHPIYTMFYCWQGGYVGGAYYYERVSFQSGNNPTQTFNSPVRYLCA